MRGEYGLRAGFPTVYPVTPERDHPDVHHHRHRGESGRGQKWPGRIGDAHHDQLRDQPEYPAQRRADSAHTTGALAFCSADGAGS